MQTLRQKLITKHHDLYIHYIDKSIGTPFFRTEKRTSKSVATTMKTYLKIVFHLCSNSFVSV